MADSEFRFTVDLLREYVTAALQNASELLEEASLLFSNGHSARAYFLAVASIEETGKALQAFDAQGRNLGDSAVTAKLRRAMEDHSQKITAAFTAMLMSSSNIRDAVMPLVDLMIHLKRGREPSMYTDIRYEESKVQIPAAMVRSVASRDCVQLAHDCLAHARNHVAEKKPEIRSRAEDELFAMKSGQFQKMVNTEGFWWYYITQLESGNRDFAAAAVAYQRGFVSKGKTFLRPEEGQGDT
jgi:AbiV family abortive infection protein